MKMLAKLWLGAACVIASSHAGAAACSVSAVSLAFGSYNPFRAAHTDSNGNIEVTCTGVSGEIVGYTIALSAGASGTPGVRRMRYGASAGLSYNLYTSTARTTVWGDGNAGTLLVSDSFAMSGTQTIRNYAVYGRTFARQNSPVGFYSDSIVVTLNF